MPRLHSWFDDERHPWNPLHVLSCVLSRLLLLLLTCFFLQTPADVRLVGEPVWRQLLMLQLNNIDPEVVRQALAALAQ